MWKTAPNYGSNWKRYFTNATHFTNVAANISEAGITAAYRRRALKLHPNKNPGNTVAATEAFKLLQKYFNLAKRNGFRPAPQPQARPTPQPQARPQARPTPKPQARPQPRAQPRPQPRRNNQEEELARFTVYRPGVREMKWRVQIVKRTYFPTAASKPPYKYIAFKVSEYRKGSFVAVTTTHIAEVAFKDMLHTRKLVPMFVSDGTGRMVRVGTSNATYGKRPKYAEMSRFAKDLLVAASSLSPTIASAVRASSGGS